LTGDSKLLHPPLIVITGPTAVGKTRTAIEIAEALPGGGEIIGADSRQIYRRMDIGTAKPTPEERARIPHHLIDIVEPDESLSVADYKARAYLTIEDILARGKIALLVGGTAQYLNATVEGWSIPQVAPNEALRAELEAFAAEHGSVALHERLKTVDMVAAAKIEHQNVRRVVRALEVYTETGRPISALQQKSAPPYRILQFVLTMERDALYARADQRVDAMMAAGFLAEVQQLLDLGYSRVLPSMSGLGYAQLAAHLQGEMSLESAIEATKIATHRFIRHQYTWFRRYNQDAAWHDSQQVDSDQLLAEIIQWLDKASLQNG
jgi:tRNA dimethylallyltransferase